MKTSLSTVLRITIVLFVIAIVLVAYLVHNSGTSTTTTSNPTTTSSATNSIHSSTSGNFFFNPNSALSFYFRLNTTVGLLSDTQGSRSIFIADDQALDYFALERLWNLTDNSSAIELASQINDSSRAYSGLFGHWNAVYVFLGHYPEPWQFNSSFALPATLGSVNGYEINYSEFNVTLTLPEYSQYADLELCYAYYLLLEHNYSGAEFAFENANKYWDGYGFADEAWDQDHLYQSYKLAIDLMVWKAMVNNPSISGFAAQYSPLIEELTLRMSSLQASDGGVYTGYFANGSTGATLENGETTSLFVLADAIQYLRNEKAKLSIASGETHFQIGGPS